MNNLSERIFFTRQTAQPTRRNLSAGGDAYARLGTEDGSALNRDFLFDFQIPACSIARRAFLRKALADLVPQCSQVVVEVAGFASGGPLRADGAFSPSILAALLPASPA